MAAWRGFRTLLRLDARQLWRERLAIVVLLVGALCAAVAAVAGAAWIDRLAAGRAAFLAESDKGVAEWSAKIAASELDADTRALLPARVTRPAAHPLPTLADFSLGRSDIEPATATLRMRHRADTLFRNYQLDNPERLMRGRLDLAFVAVVVAPLLLIALGYGVFAGERERGTAWLVLAQAGSPLALLLARSVNRLLLAFAPLALAALALLAVGPELPGRGAAAMAWLAIAALGLAFWWSLVLLVNSLRIGAESAALALVGLWALLVFVAPAAINAGAQALHPPPSRLAQIVQARAAELAAAAAYENDHPTLGAPGAAGVRETVRRNYRIGLAIERRLAPGVAAFERRLAQQQSVASIAQLAAPPMAVSGALAEVAGTDARTYAALRGGARDALARFKQALAAPVEHGAAFDRAFDARLPAFVPDAPPRTPPLAVPFVLLLTLGCGAVALWRLRHPRLD